MKVYVEECRKLLLVIPLLQNSFTKHQKKFFALKPRLFPVKMTYFAFFNRSWPKCFYQDLLNDQKQNINALPDSIIMTNG